MWTLIKTPEKGLLGFWYMPRTPPEPMDFGLVEHLTTWSMTVIYKSVLRLISTLRNDTDNEMHFQNTSYSLHTSQ